MAKRRSQLVTQHLERVSSKILEDYQDVIRNFIRGRHGIYALYKGSKLYYVGLAKDLRGRLRIHLGRDRHAGLWDHFSVYLTLDNKHLKELESLVLCIASPRGNRAGGNFVNSENLLRALRRHWERRKQEEKRALFFSDQGFGANRLLLGKDCGESAKKTGILFKYAVVGKPIRFTYKNKTHKGRVLRNGMISFKGKLFNSPSMACQLVIRKPANGWVVWRYQRSPGAWVALDNLRH